MTALGIVIPTLDEIARVASLVEVLGHQIEAQDVVVIADNGSSDGTVELLHDLALDRPWLEVLEEPRRGPGWARRAGAHHLLRRPTVDPRSTWIVSCDADAEPGSDHMRTWRRHLARTGADLVTGGYRFAADDVAAISGAEAAFRTFAEVAAGCESCVGVVNPTGSNHAVRASSYLRTGGYQQPRSTRLAVGSCVVAGDDWDLGVRARLAGLSVERIDLSVEVSARRFLADPAGYITGALHDGPFERVEAQGAPMSTLDDLDLTRAAAARAVLHFLLKPLLLGIGNLGPVMDLCALLDPSLGEAVVASRGAGLRLWREDRDGFIYDLLRSQAPLAEAVGDALLSRSTSVWVSSGVPSTPSSHPLGAT